MVRVTILPDRQVQEVDATTVSDVLTALGLHRDAHLVVRGEDILTSDTRLTETDELEIVPVISGGGQGGPPPSNWGQGGPPPSNWGQGGPPPSNWDQP